jgi:hypothetical protein
MKYLLVFLPVLVCMVIGCSDAPTSLPINSDQSSVGFLEKKNPVPFSANLNGGSPPPVPSSECEGLLLTEITGEGNATHLGKFSAVQRHCLNPQNFTFDNGWLEYTAANGDKLYGSYSGFLSPTPDPIILEITGAFELTGGTGRFANAAGEGNASGWIDVTTGNFVLALDGDIIY